MSQKFDVDSLVSLQSLAFPLIRALGGPDVAAAIASGAPYLDAVGDVLHEAGDVFKAAAEAERDGVATRPEIDAVVAEAIDAQVAATKLWGMVHPVRVESVDGAATAPADPGQQ